MSVFWWFMLGKGTLFCPKKVSKPKVFPKVHFQLLSRVPSKTHMPNKNAKHEAQKERNKESVSYYLIREVLIHFTEFIFRISDEVLVRVSPLDVTIQSLHP